MSPHCADSSASNGHGASSPGTVQHDAQMYSERLSTGPPAADSVNCSSDSEQAEHQQRREVHAADAPGTVAAARRQAATFDPR